MTFRRIANLPRGEGHKWFKPMPELALMLLDMSERQYARDTKNYLALNSSQLYGRWGHAKLVRRDGR